MKPEKFSKDAFDILVARQGLADDDEYKSVFDGLEKEFDKALLERIEKIKKRCVLLVGKDIDIVRKIACYLYYKGDTWGFYHIDCLNEKDIEKKLHYFERSTLFLEDFNTQDHALIKRLDARINDILRSDTKTRFIKVTINGVTSTPKGLLIIHTRTVDDLPEYFKRLFDVVGFESEKRNGARAAKIIPFPTPAGTQWHEVKISFIDNENVKISAKNVTEHRHYSGMGFKDSKSGKPIFLWKFLKELASLNGNFTNCPDKGKGKVKKYFSDLRKALRQIFKTIEGDPISYKKTTGYETAFLIEDKSHNRDYEESIRRHYKEYVPPKNTHCNYKNEDDCEDSDFGLDD